VGGNDDMNPSRFRWFWMASGFAAAAWLAIVVVFDWSGVSPQEMARSSRPEVAVGKMKSAPVRRVAVESRAAELEAPAMTEAERRLERLRQRVERKSALAKQAVLKFKSAAAMTELLRRAAGRRVTVLGRLDALLTARVAYEDLEQLSDWIGPESGALEDVDGNYVVRIPDFLQQEDRPGGAGSASFRGLGFLAAMGAKGDRSTWGLGVTVAVVDCGVENHPTFGEGQVTHYDLVNDGQGFNGHGTAVASLIAGQDPQAPGVAPGSHILDVRVANGEGFSDTYTLAAGIVQAADAGALVINVSMGAYASSQALRDAVVYAESRGAVVVAAAGNDHTANSLAFPAAFSGVVAVGGVDANYQQAYYSNSGSGLDVSAPGVGIQSAYGTDQLVVGDGTSQAAALASGVLAYGLSRGVPAGPLAAAWLQQTAMPLSQPPNRVGAGMVQAQAK
jgi:thermitase